MAFIAAHQSRFGVEQVCRVLTEHDCRISPSGYYAQRTRPASARAVRDQRVLAEVTRVHADPAIGRGLYGAPKVWHQLKRQGGVDGAPVPRCQVERMMRAAGLHGARRGTVFRTTVADAFAARPPDLVKRDFTASRPNALWLVDFTYIPTWSGMAFTRSCPTPSRAGSWAGAPRAACPRSCRSTPGDGVWTRARAGEQVTGLIHHSDAGSQYTSIRYNERLLTAGAVASIGTVGDSYDNAEAESLIGRYKTECTKRDGPWKGVDDLELATLGWVSSFNDNRLHSSLGYVPPVEYETEHYRHNSLPQQPLPGELALQ